MTARRPLQVAPDAPQAAVGYVRVSMAREEMISPDLQKGYLRDHEGRHPVHIAEVVEDLDVSGRSFARAGIQRIIRGVEAGEWQVVLVYRYDRFGRNVRQSLVNIAKVEEAGGRVVSVTEPFDASTAIGKYGRTNILAVAELQSDLIGEGWKSTHAHRAARGLPHSGRPRFGYLYIDGGYVPDPATAPHLLAAYRAFVEGRSVRSICRQLNDGGVRTTAGGLWVPITLYRVLDSGFAAGLLFQRSTGQHQPGAHEPIVDEQLWARFQKARRDGRTVSPWSRHPAHTLSGLIRCGGCGKPMASGYTREPGRDEPRRYYRCSTRVAGQSCPGGGAIAGHLVEAFVRAWVDEEAGDLERQARAAAARLEVVVERKQDRAHFSRQVARSDRQLKQLLLDRSEGLISDTAAFLAAQAEITAQRDAALAQLEAAEDDVALLARAHRPTIRALSEAWDEMDVLGRRDMLRRLLRRVEVNAKSSGKPRVVPVPVWERDP